MTHILRVAIEEIDRGHLIYRVLELNERVSTIKYLNLLHFKIKFNFIQS